MSLHGGIDTVGVISHGVFTKTYGVDEEANVANIYVSFGYLEDAPGSVSGWVGFIHWFWEFL